jgi:hypothetical protein
VVVFVIMLPITLKTGDPVKGWEAGLTWVFIQSFVLMIGGFIAPYIRKITPRAALLGALAGISITFISMRPALEMFMTPGIGLICFAIILVSWFGGFKYPKGIPAGLVAIAVGILRHQVRNVHDPRATHYACDHAAGCLQYRVVHTVFGVGRGHPAVDVAHQRVQREVAQDRGGRGAQHRMVIYEPFAQAFAPARTDGAAKAERPAARPPPAIRAAGPAWRIAAWRSRGCA